MAAVKDGLNGALANNHLYKEENIKKNLILYNTTSPEVIGIPESYIKMLKFLHYWAQKMKKVIQKDTVMLFLHNEEDSLPIQMDKFLFELSQLIDLNKIKGFYQPRNNRIIGIELKNVQFTNELLSLDMIGGHHVIFLHWALDSEIIKARIHWFPNSFNIDKIVALFNEHAIVVQINRKKLLFQQFEFISNVIELAAILRKNSTVFDLPHLLTIDGIDILITIKGRKTICLNCGSTKHILRECGKREVNNDGEVHQIHKVLTAEESKSYAEAVLNKNNKVHVENTDAELITQHIHRQQCKHQIEEANIIDNLQEQNLEVIVLPDHLEESKSLNQSVSGVDLTKEIKTTTNNNAMEVTTANIKRKDINDSKEDIYNTSLNSNFEINQESTKKVKFKEKT